MIGWYWVTDWKECGGKRPSFYILRYYAIIFRCVLRKHYKNHETEWPVPQARFEERTPLPLEPLCSESFVQKLRTAKQTGERWLWRQLRDMIETCSFGFLRSLVRIGPKCRDSITLSHDVMYVQICWAESSSKTNSCSASPILISCTVSGQFTDPSHTVSISTCGFTFSIPSVTSNVNIEVKLSACTPWGEREIAGIAAGILILGTRGKSMAILMPCHVCLLNM